MQGNDGPHFNLIDEPWILVVMNDGSLREVSLRTLFTEAPSIAGVSGDSPQQIVPIIRLLLAILYSAYREAYIPDMAHREQLEVWKESWRAGEFDQEALESYFEKWHDRFDLFGERPFMQVAGLAYESKDKQWDPTSELIGDMPKPDKYLFSMRLKDSPNRLMFSEAARWLLYLQSYDCAGIKTPVVGNSHASQGKAHAPKGLPGIGWLGSIGSVFLEGSTLFETLMLNFVMYDEDPHRGDCFTAEGDFPSWESDVATSDVASFSPAGPAGLFTVRDRRVRLIPTPTGDAVEGVIASYGDIVRPTEASACETMTAWRESEQQQKKLGLAEPPLMPLTHDCDKALWRGLGPLLLRAPSPTGKDTRPGVIHWFELLEDEEVDGLPRIVCIHAQGLEYGVQGSAVVNAYDDALDISDMMLRGDTEAVGYATRTVSQIEDGVRCLTRLVKEVGDLAGGDSDDGSVERAARDAREEAYLALDDLSRGYLRSFSSECSPYEHCAAWRREARDVLWASGKEYSLRFPVSGFIRKEKKTVAGAWRWFCASLDKALDITKDDL